jgi:hypothetical protein
MTNFKDFYTETYPEDVPPKATWNGEGWQNKVTEYKGFRIGVPNNEFPYLVGVLDTDIPELQGTFTKLRQAETAIDVYLEEKAPTS